MTPPSSAGADGQRNGVRDYAQSSGSDCDSCGIARYAGSAGILPAQTAGDPRRCARAGSPRSQDIRDPTKPYDRDVLGT